MQSLLVFLLLAGARALPAYRDKNALVHGAEDDELSSESTKHGPKWRTPVGHGKLGLAAGRLRKIAGRSNLLDPPDLERDRDAEAPSDSYAKRMHHAWDGLPLPVFGDEATGSVKVGGKELGTGSFKKVWVGDLAYNLDGPHRMEVAVAEIKLTTEAGLDMVRKEGPIQKLVGDEAARVQGADSNVMGIIGEAYYKQGEWEPRDEWAGAGRFVVLQPLCLGGDLWKTASDPLYRFSGTRKRELEAGAIMWQFFTGLLVMHKMGVAHRDIKLENTLLLEPFDSAAFKTCFEGLAPRKRWWRLFQKKKTTNIATLSTDCLPAGDVKIADFGFSAEGGDEEKPQAVWGVKGTPGYAAPELASPSFTTIPTDIFSAGYMWLLLLTLQDPCSVSESKIFCNANEINRALRRLEGYSAEQIALITGMLKVNPSERFTIDDVFASTFWNKPQRA